MDLSKIKTIPIRDRTHKVNLPHIGSVSEGTEFADFYDSLPDVLGARDLKRAAKAVADASDNGGEVILAMGAHPIKCGLSPLIIHLMERGILTCVALNGAGIIHDFELAYIGETSEDVAETLRDGSFGMVEETGRILNEAMKKGLEKKLGAGASMASSSWRPWAWRRLVLP